MPLSEAIQSIMRAKTLRNTDLLATAGRQRDRTTMYRLLNGETEDPKISTLVEVCASLGVSPNELLELSGNWVPSKRSTTPSDIGLRAVFARIQALPDQRKELALRLIQAMVLVLEEPSPAPNP